MDETPEVVLARLERYADSLRRGQPAVRVTAAAPPPALPRAKHAYVAVAPSAAPVDEFIPPETDEVPSIRRPLIETLAQLIAVIACVSVIVVFMTFGRAAGAVIAVGLTVAGVTGMVRRVPVSGWFTLGVVIAGILGLFS